MYLYTIQNIPEKRFCWLQLKDSPAFVIIYKFGFRNMATDIMGNNSY
jgi:hypothetical protein